MVNQKVCKKKYLSWVYGVDRKICNSGSLFGITRQASWCRSVTLVTDFSIHTIHTWKILIVSHVADRSMIGITFAALASVAYRILVKRQFFPFQNNPKYLDLSYKMDLDLWDCLGKKKQLCIITKFYNTDLVTCIWSHSRERKTLSYSWVNTVNFHGIFWFSSVLWQCADRWDITVCEILVSSLHKFSELHLRYCWISLELSCDPTRTTTHLICLIASHI